MADPVDNDRELTGDDAIRFAHQSGMEGAAKGLYYAGIGDLIRFARLVRHGWVRAASPSTHQPQTSALERKDALLRQVRDFAEEVHSGEWAGSPTRRDELVNAIDAELSPEQKGGV